MSQVFEALGNDRFDEVMQALDADPSLAKTSNAKGSTLLMGAAMKGHVALFEKLIALGADVDAVRARGVTALRFAIERKQVGLAERLLALGATARHDERPYDLLRFALNSGPALAVKLIEAGLRLDVPHDESGEPILYVLARTGIDAVRAYEAAGGSFDVRWGKRSPVQVAARADQAEVVALLVARGAPADEALEPALEADAVAVIAWLVDTGADPAKVLAWLGDLDVKPVRDALVRRGVAVPSQPTGSLLGDTELRRFFDERGISERLEGWWPHDFTDGRALLLPGGTTVPSLRLDFDEEAWPGGPFLGAGLVVDGDLTIEGTLENGEQDFGPFLVVLGTLTVKNVAISGAPLHVEGDLRVRGAFHGYYNHGSTRVEGTLDAGLFIAQDYGVVLNGPVRGDVLEARGHITARHDFPRAAFDLLADEFAGDEPGWPDDEAIMKALAEGRSLRR